jgi:FMN phosphatase YigB (HAD superfamily)
MIDAQRFEIQLAFDLLPHVVGCSWATIWFRLNKIKNPTREEFREKVTEYFKMLEPLLDVYPQDKNFEEIISYLKKRNAVELEKISNGKNPEVEKRYDRYVDYR